VDALRPHFPGPERHNSAVQQLHNAVSISCCQRKLACHQSDELAGSCVMLGR
jgi:hypothetical protein